MPLLRGSSLPQSPQAWSYFWYRTIILLFSMFVPAVFQHSNPDSRSLAMELLDTNYGPTRTRLIFVPLLLALPICANFWEGWLLWGQNFHLWLFLSLFFPRCLLTGMPWHVFYHILSSDGNANSSFCGVNCCFDAVMIKARGAGSFISTFYC